jgi:cellulose 1,4-beta-cellobiosidase
MFDRYPHLATFRGFTVAVLACVALLAGCVPKTSRMAPVPANVTATGGVGAIDISWSASVGASSYNVKRATVSGGPFTQLASTAALSYADASAAAGTTYYYVVSAVAPDGESANSAAVSAALVAVPSAPANLVATPGDGQVGLAWNASSGATGYRVKRSTTSGGPYTQIATPTGTTYTDTAVTNGTTYYYVVSATNVAGESANSAQVIATPTVIPTQFGTWTNVTPAGVDLTTELCSNFGATSVQTDPVHPSHLYTLFHCQGVWKSTDYGLTWTGPINTGTNGASVTNCSGGLSISPTSTANPPVI